MHGATDDRHADSTGPPTELPAAITSAGALLGAWVRTTLIILIGLMTLVATAMAIVDIVRSGRVNISDVLLLFIYLEIWAMIVVEATTLRLPVNFIVYIAITALTRHLVGVAGDKSTTDVGLLVDAVAILVLVLAAVLLDWKLFRTSEKMRSPVIS